MKACFRCLVLFILVAGFRPADFLAAGFSSARFSPARFAPAPHPRSADILRYVNEHRRSMGLPVLQGNSFISSVALRHSRDMLSGKTPFGHDGFHDRILEIRGHLGVLHVAAENVASGPMSAREVVDGWLHSPGHRRNIEGDFRLTGIGLAAGDNGMIYFTQIFVK